MSDFSEDMVIGIARLRRHYGLTETEGRILYVLSSGLGVTYEKLIAECCRGRTDKKAINVHVWRMRKRLAPVAITNINGVGYFLDPSSLATVRAVMRGEL